ncbi:hypothetical protein N7E81_15245 [Reichenbachiella carrageenanivorans]|uniref:Uncharacterized protein n=1 Tax=Reichenbachiella carrageenanivorans TaxID=2979869 RepID=A0ABY6CYB2_9BACT|nr:hypothetical protein [Reichenbachiella carrageenanivorans]UXX78714.1 hypothetical protein N7E81_15245 [Reichenbachiella carrageenanivorans]
MKLINTLALSILICTTGLAQSISLGDVYPKEMKIQGFSVSQNSEVVITGTGAVFEDDWKYLIYYGWIIDAETRAVVWHLFDFMKREDMDEVDGPFDFKTKLNLKKGHYELYFAGMYDSRSWNKYRDEDGDWSISGLSDTMDWLFGTRDKENYRRSTQDELYIRLDGKMIQTTDANVFMEKKRAEAIVSYVKAKDNDRFTKGFTLLGETEVQVYALGEGDDDEMFDYAWVIDANTRKRVFEMRNRNARFAGGATKNLVVNEKITLPAGDYLVNYTTDGSHSFERWNALPPDDPQFWGVSVWADSKKHVVAYQEPKNGKPLVSLTRARDNEMLAKGISIKKTMEVRVFCLGEEGHGDDMADFGWIVDASTRERIWDMKPYKTKHAGGADKNRSVEEVITLDPGDYIVYYATDDSHAYGRWNSSQPYEPEMWGITVWAVKESEVKNVVPFHPEMYKNKNELAVIMMVGDRALMKKTFSVDQDTKVRVKGLGEGSGNEMYDFGYIRNLDTDEIVWEMEYRNSDHGGGARKNRSFDETMTLKKGAYRVYYETDDSHSYRRWNDDPPNDPAMWGIMVLKD